MTSHWCCLVLVACCSSTVFSQQPATAPKRTTTATVQKATPAAKVKDVSTAMKQATSLEALQAAVAKANLTSGDRKALQAEIEASPELKQKISQYQNQAFEAAKQQNAQAQPPDFATTMEKQLNDEREAKFTTAARKVVPGTQGLAVPRDLSAVLPSILHVDALTPGVPFRVLATRAGKQRGTVELTTGGIVFPAIVRAWSDTLIEAILSYNVVGVRKDNQARLKIKTATGPSATAKTTFEPLIEVKMLDIAGFCAGSAFCLGDSKDKTVFNYSLKNDWYVTNVLFSKNGEGTARITENPPYNVPNGSARTRVHLGTSWCGIICCNLNLYVAGPKGLNPR